MIGTGSSFNFKNPILWISLVIIGLIVFVIFSGDRAQFPHQNNQNGISSSAQRGLIAPPGMRARQYLDLIRSEGEPFPLNLIFDKANVFLQDGQLADSHLLYFFAAREGHLSSIMKLAEMSDPTRFEAENSLLDNADVIQAYKWYQQAADLNHSGAKKRLKELQLWAADEAKKGNPHARQLLLNYK